MMLWNRESLEGPVRRKTPGTPRRDQPPELSPHLETPMLLALDSSLPPSILGWSRNKEWNNGRYASYGKAFLFFVISKLTFCGLCLDNSTQWGDWVNTLYSWYKLKDDMTSTSSFRTFGRKCDPQTWQMMQII